MGWWKIANVKTGQIDWNTKDKLVNATPENTTTELVNGDEPANTMEDAINLIREQYKFEWNREPTKSELQAVFNFVINPIKLKP